MKLSCTPISFQKAFRSGDMTLSKFITFCAEQKLSGADLLDPDFYPWGWDSGTTLRDALHRIREAGLDVGAFGCGNNFAKFDPGERNQQVEMVKTAIRRASECGASVLRIFGGYHQETGGDTQITYSLGLTLIKEGIEKCLPEAERQGVILALENHGRLPGHSHESVAIFNHFSSPYLKATFDPANYLGNSMDEDEDPIRAYEALRGHIAYVHLKDVWPAKHNPNRRREPCVAGKGLTPIRQIVAALARDKFDGYCSLEFEASAIIDETEGVVQSLNYLREVGRAARIFLR